MEPFRNFLSGLGWCKKRALKTVKGIHDLYFVFKGEKDLFYFDWWKIN